jgi:cutinase
VVNRLKRQAIACPRQTFSLVGYSQGAGVMHSAAKDIPLYLYPRIKSLVMFGDGYHRLGPVLSRFPTGLNEKVMQICAPGDPVRDHPRSSKETGSTCGLTLYVFICAGLRSRC